MTTTNNQVSEVANADWEFDVVRTYVLGVEILDQRISDGEYRLLHLLRLRASGGRNNIVSYETLAKDLNCHPKTIATRMANLKINGYVTCQKRGLSAPTLKTITSMVDRYDHEILKMSRKDLLGKERTNELMERLHCVDNGADGPLGVKTLPMETTTETTTRRERKRSHVGSENAPTEGVETLPQVNQDKEIPERDGFGCAKTVSSPDPDPGGEERSRTTVVPDRSEVPEEPRDDRPETSALQDLADGVAASALGKGQALVRRTRGRRAKAEAPVGSEVKEHMDDLTLDEVKQGRTMSRLERQTIGYKFMRWSMQEYDRFFSEVQMGNWLKQEFGQFGSLMEAYSDNEPLIRKAWTYLVENWEDLSKKLKIRGSAPSIGVLLGFRQLIFPIVQEREKDRTIAERTPLVTKFGEW